LFLLIISSLNGINIDSSIDFISKSFVIKTIVFKNFQISSEKDFEISFFHKKDIGLNGFLNQIGNKIKSSQNLLISSSKKSFKNFPKSSTFLFINEKINSSNSFVNA